MAIDKILNGPVETGYGARTKLNQVIDLINKLTGNQDGYSYPYEKVTTVERIALTGMEEGAHVYDTDEHSVFYYNGSIWIQAY